MITEILLTIVVLLLLLLIILVSKVLVSKGGKIESRDIESAMYKVWQESGLDKNVGEIRAHVRDIKDAHTSIEQMFRTPKERASMGELSLETILSDQLPPDMFGIREKILDGKNPDAYIKSTVGQICIDSKFPLDNYRKMVETETLRR